MHLVETNIVECRPLLGALPPSLIPEDPELPAPRHRPLPGAALGKGGGAGVSRGILLPCGACAFWGSWAWGFGASGSRVLDLGGLRVLGLGGLGVKNVEVLATHHQAATSQMGT